MKTLLGRQSALSNTLRQIHVINHFSPAVEALPKFEHRLEGAGLYPLKALDIETLQINVGKMCNQVCKHCHVDAGPSRTEIMTKPTMQHCLNAIQASQIRTVDLTGGAPEMNPEFRWLVESIRALGRNVIVRSNLTILLASAKYEDLPQFFASNNVHVISSLPYYEKKSTDRQRGLGVFEKSIEALRRLNAVGYATEPGNLSLDLVYNPVGAFLPGPEKELEVDFKRELKRVYGIQFSRLLAITNLPVSRFLDYLVESENLEDYMATLTQAFNATAAAGVMCRTLISVGWDGMLYDCDFNQMLELKVTPERSQHIKDFSPEALRHRTIVVNQHCYGCTAGQGSSCGGSVA